LKIWIESFGHDDLVASGTVTQDSMLSHAPDLKQYNFFLGSTQTKTYHSMRNQDHGLLPLTVQPVIFERAKHLHETFANGPEPFSVIQTTFQAIHMAHGMCPF